MRKAFVILSLFVTIGIAGYAQTPADAVQDVITAAESKAAFNKYKTSVAVESIVESAVAEADKKGLETTSWLEKIRQLIASQGVQDANNAARQLNSTWQQIQSTDSVRQLFETVYGTSESIARLFEKTEKLTELYTAYQDFFKVYDNIQNQLTRLYNDGLISIFDWDIYMTQLIGELFAIMKTIDDVKVFLDIDTKINNEQRIQAVDNATEKIQTVTEEAKARQRELVKEQLEKVESGSMLLGTAIASHNPQAKISTGDRAGTAPVASNNDITSHSDFANGSGYTTIVNEDNATIDTATKTVGSLFNGIYTIVVIIISIVAILMVVMNFVRYTKNEAGGRHRDALFKVITGYIVSLIILTLIKTLLTS